MKINENYKKLKQNYLFATISSKVLEFKNKNPDKKIINMGIGDVTLPLCRSVIENLEKAVKDMSLKETFKGYGPYRGYDFLIDKIIKKYKIRNVNLQNSEVFISDGAKSDCANILDIFESGQKVLIPDPVYPAYMDSNIMCGNEVIFADATEKNGFLPSPPENLRVDIIYICSPNNPTGGTYTKKDLKAWVNYANSMDAIIIFDAAYKDFIEDESLPKSIFEIPEARNCAIEIASFSKTAGFTGVRCGYTIIPRELKREGQSLSEMWFRHQSSNYNGTSYIVQKAAEAVFSEKGEIEIENNLKYYKENAKIISKTLTDMNIFYTGGKNSPYIWFECINNLNSWDFFDVMLNELQIVGTPGEGFGKNGKNFFRLTAFGLKEDTVYAMRKIKEYFK